MSETRKHATSFCFHTSAANPTIDVAVVHGEAALAREVHGLGAHQAQAVVAGEGLPEIDARLLRQPRQAGRQDLRLARAPHERPRVLVDNGAHDLLHGIGGHDARQDGQHEEHEGERGGGGGHERAEPHRPPRTIRRLYEADAQARRRRVAR